MKTPHRNLARPFTRRKLLGRGAVLAAVLSFGGVAEGATVETPREEAEMRRGVATSHAIESAGFDDKPFWFDGRNGSTARFASADGGGGARGEETVLDGYVGWRIVDADADSGENSWNRLTTLFLPAETVVERGRETRYRLAGVGPPVVGEFRRLNGNHTTERLYPVSFERVSD